MKKLLVFAFCLVAIMGWSQGRLPVVAATGFRKDSLLITKNGAVGDGLTLNTKAINTSIDQLSKKGGGVVVVPPGLWLTGPIVLKSNINLHIKAGGTLLFTKDFDQYPLVEANWEGLPQMRNQSPISATNATNIALTGKGIIDGNGDAWRAVKKEKLSESQWKRLVASGGLVGDDKKTWYPTESSYKGSKITNPGVISADKTPEYYQSVKDFFRPNLVVFTSCKKVLLEGLTFQNSPAWNLHPLMCQDLIVRNVSVKNPWYAQNGDGIDVESCKNVLIENSVFDVGDDGICIKSGRDEAGRKRAMPTENVFVRNCVVYAAHGGFVIGSEMSGGARNIYVEDCTFIGTDIGLRFKTTRGRGGIVENIFISRISMKNIVGEAILFDMYYMAKDPIPLASEKRELPAVEFRTVDETTPVFRNFVIKNIYCNGAEKAVFIRGLPEKHISDIRFSDMVMQSNKGFDIQEATGISFKDVKLFTTEGETAIDVLQSEKVWFSGIEFSNTMKVWLRVAGERSRELRLAGTVPAMSAERIQTELGAKPESVSQR